MPMATEITAEELIAIANSPGSTTTDGVTVTERPIDDVIKADQYAGAKRALTGTNANGGGRSGWKTLRTGRVVPPGGV
jgi:hypothetical protein